MVQLQSKLEDEQSLAAQLHKKIKELQVGAERILFSFLFFTAAAVVCFVLALLRLVSRSWRRPWRRSGHGVPRRNDRGTTLPENWRSWERSWRRQEEPQRLRSPSTG